METAAATDNVWALGKDEARVQALARGVVRVEGPILEPIVVDMEKRAVSPIVFGCLVVLTFLVCAHAYVLPCFWW